MEGMKFKCKEGILNGKKCREMPDCGALCVCVTVTTYRARPYILPTRALG